MNCLLRGLSEEEGKTMEQILMSDETSFRIKLDWVENAMDFFYFPIRIERELKKCGFQIHDQLLVLNQGNKYWRIFLKKLK